MSNARYWESQERIFEDNLDKDSLTRYEERELEESINRWGRYPTSFERSPYFGNHNGPSQVALNGPTTVSQGVRRMISTSRPINVPSIVKIPLILPDGSSIGHKWQTTKGLDQPSPEETTIMGKADYEYWVKWTEVLPYRFDSMRPTEIPVDGFDFKLSIWRSKKGWKWWLLHSSTIPDMSIENQFMWLEPFTKPSLVTVFQRGKFSAKSFQPRRASKLLLDEIKQNAELRWGGVPVSEKEKQKDASKLRDKIWVEGIVDHYGFLGQALSNASSEMKSSVKVLFLIISTLWSIIFIFGPIKLAPILSELLVGIIPAQNTLAGILAMKKDEKREAGEEFTMGGNARQWLVYWPFYQVSSMIVGWIYIARPTWYWWAIAWRTLLLLGCGSPYFGEFNFNAPSARLQKIRLTRQIWLARGKARQNEAILRPSVREQKVKRATLDKIIGKLKSSPESGVKVEFVPSERNAQLLEQGRQVLGFLEEYAQYPMADGTANKKSGSSRAEGLRKSMVVLAQAAAEAKSIQGAVNTTPEELEKMEPDAKEALEKTRKKDGFKAYRDWEEAMSQVERNILKNHNLMRTTPGGHGLAAMIRHKYGASDEEIASYLNVYNDELGVRLARDVGIDKAYEQAAMRSQWATELASQSILEPETKHLPWEREWDIKSIGYKGPPDVSDEAIAYQRGDPDARAKWNDPEVRAVWKEELARYDDLVNKDGEAKTAADLPWSIHYAYRGPEDLVEDDELHSESKTYMERRPVKGNPSSRRWLAASNLS